MTTVPDADGFAGGPALRVAELAAGLSLAADLGMGQPMEHGLRTAALSVRLGDALGLSERELADAYYVALLRPIGCTASAHDLSRRFGDDIAANAAGLLADLRDPPSALVGGLGEREFHDVLDAMTAGNCEVAQRLASRLGLDSVEGTLSYSYERWDGMGWPHRLRGEEYPLAMRIVQIAEVAEVLDRRSGRDAATGLVGRRAGGQFDPAIVKVLSERTDELLAGLDTDGTLQGVLDLEPGPRPRLHDEQLDVGLEALADFADIKSPFTAGHSRGVARLAVDAASHAGLADIPTIGRAALVHDLGRAGVSNTIWSKPGPLTEGEWEHVRLHPYFTERILARPGALRSLGLIAALHHERLDGSGYAKGLPGGMLPAAARILGAADAYHAMLEPRPHRPPMSPEAAAEALRRAARAGHLDGDAVEAVLVAAGHRELRRGRWPARLTAREAEILGLIARALSNRRIAVALGISERTVENHIQRIYTKIGVSTRPGAVLFAIQHGLVASHFPEQS